MSQKVQMTNTMLEVIYVSTHSNNQSSGVRNYKHKVQKFQFLITNQTLKLYGTVVFVANVSTNH